MGVSPATSSNYSSSLSALNSESWALKDAKVTDEVLESLAGRTDLVIRAVDAPLSTISAKTLKLFVKAHDSNLERFNLQNNNEIDGATLVDLAKMMPHLKTLSFQYLHQVTDEDLLKVVNACQDLETLRICQNSRISKEAFYQILNLDRNFLKLSVDLAGRQKKTSGASGADREVRAQVEALRLSGLSFGSSDIDPILKIKGLRNVELALTSVTAEDVARISEGQLGVTVQDISPKKLSGFEKGFIERGLSYTRSGRNIRVVQGASEGL
ncbi:hypothetical protein [Simkania sp.]|uniref:hypothetical protein n=1 Tax=Simkania sp. TaxID=34094 RepID=UPI003B51DFA7